MRSNKLADMDMLPLVWNMSLPLMASLMIQSLYNIVDSVFVSRLSQEALAATSLAFPMQILMIAVGVGTAVGVNAVLSKALGAKDIVMIENTTAIAVFLAIVSTIVFIFLGLTIVPLFVGCFTSEEKMIQMCSKYLSICMIFSAGSFVATMYQRFLQAAGNTFDSMLSLAAGAVINILLDPILIFGLWFFPELGISGAAIATVIGQWISALTAIILNKHRNPYINFSWKNLTFDLKILRQIYRVGLPTIITQAIGCLMMSSMNVILMSFSQAAVAFFGIYYKLQNFLFMPMNGLGQAAIPIIGFNYGAKNFTRIKEAFRVMVPFASVTAFVMTVIFMVFPKELLMMFHPTEELLKIGVPALRIIAPTFVFASVSIILGYSASGFGIGLVNMIATLIRQLIVLIPLSGFLAVSFGITSVWYAFWFSEWIAFVYAVLSTKKIVQQKALEIK